MDVRKALGLARVFVGVDADFGDRAAIKHRPHLCIRGFESYVAHVRHQIAGRLHRAQESILICQKPPNLTDSLCKSLQQKSKNRQPNSSMASLYQVLSRGRKTTRGQEGMTLGAASRGSLECRPPVRIRPGVDCRPLPPLRGPAETQGCTRICCASIITPSHFSAARYPSSCAATPN